MSTKPMPKQSFDEHSTPPIAQVEKDPRKMTAKEMGDLVVQRIIESFKKYADNPPETP